MDHPIDVEVELTNFWLGDATLSGIVLRFGRAAEEDVVPYVVADTVSSVKASNRRKVAGARTTNTEYMESIIRLKCYEVDEYQAGQLSKTVLAQFQDDIGGPIGDSLQVTVMDYGHAEEEADRIWRWVSLLDILHPRTRI